MRVVSWAATVALMAVLNCGCEEAVQKPVQAPVAVAATNATASGTGRAQPRLPTVKLWLGAEELITEIATTPRQVQTGMMFRESMSENEAMLFVFSIPHRASFYMKHTVLPLSCAYIGSDGTILEIHDMKPLDESPIEAASPRIQYVLETNQGWFERHKVSVGTVVRTEHGSLAETFQKRR